MAESTNARHKHRNSVYKKMMKKKKKKHKKRHEQGLTRSAVRTLFGKGIPGKSGRCRLPHGAVHFINRLSKAARNRSIHN